MNKELKKLIDFANDDLENKTFIHPLIKAIMLHFWVGYLLLQYLYGNTNERTTLKAHMTINQVTKMTAIKDLKDLVKKHFLTANKCGRNVYYYGSEKIKELF